MADHHHHHHHRPNRISLPTRAAYAAAATPTPRPAYPVFPYTPSTPAATPSKLRRSRVSGASAATSSSSFSFLFLLLFSLRSLYSLFPFLRASPPSFSIFPFSFLVSLLSFVLTFSFSLFASIFSGDSITRKSPFLSLTQISQSQNKLLAAKSLLLAVVFLLRFQALRYCGAAAMILAELAGTVAARFMAEGKNRIPTDRNSIGSSKLRGFIALLSGLILLSVSWDRIECFPFSHVNIMSKGFVAFPSSNCLRIWPMLLPFFSGFLGCYERVLLNWGEIRELGQKRVRLITLFYTTVILFIPACISMLVFEVEGDTISLSILGWPLANTVIFGVLLSENYTDERVAASKDIQKEYFVTFLCTLVLELFYFPELSLWGLLICGLLLWIAVRELNLFYINYPELGVDSSGSFSFDVMKPIRHILSERKSRKIALFLLINTAYMVVEFAAGFMSNSLGLISDACHMLFDCAALAIGLYASYISRLPANSQFNYGRGRFEVLSGYVNAVFLVLVGALITLESFERILDPQEISTSSLLSVSVGGLVVNMVGLVFFHEEHHHAHGGSGSCSHSHHEEAHSHSHSHSHSHHYHHDAHENGEKHQDLVGTGEKLCSKDKAGHKCDDHHHHHPKNEVDMGGLQCDHHKPKNDLDVRGHECDHLDMGGHKHDNDHHHLKNDFGMGGHKHDHDHHHPKNDLDTGGQKHDHDNHHPKNDHHSHVELHGHSHHHVSVDDHLHHHEHDHSSILGEKEKKKNHHHHHHIDHNMQGIFLHVLADTLGSVGVVISTLLIKYKGWLVADPACSIFISALIVSSVIPLLRNSAEILLQRVPRNSEHDLKEALNDMMKLKGVLGTQNLHVWSFTNSEVVGTIHLHVSADSDKTSIKRQVSHILHEAGVKDLVVQVESMPSNMESVQPLL